MRIWHLCIDRPVLASVFSLLLLVFGAISLGRLPNRELPDVDPPIVSVVTVLPGAAPEVIETSVTQVLEDELVGIENIRHLRSESREQVSSISVEFEMGTDVDFAAADVRDRVARARFRLPEEVEEPVVAKADADAFPIMWIDTWGGGLGPIELTRLLETRVKDRLARLPGVSRVELYGERRHAIRLWIDPSRLAARGLVIADVAEALRTQHVDIPSGRVEGPDQEFTVRTPGEMRTPEEFGALILANREGSPVRLRDVGRAVVGAEDERSLVRIDGAAAVGLGVTKRSGANTLEVARAVHAEIERLQPLLPEGVRIVAGYDSSIYIERSIRDVTASIVYAVLFVLVVIYIFLRSLRATLVPAISIPVSIIGCMSVLYLFDFSINTLTLLGITLAIGLVVDDAIVVLENVSRWRDRGLSPEEAARRGIDEVAFAVIAASVSVIAVFLPLAFLTDMTGRLFREFGITVAAAVAVSGFVALTLSPSLCARILRPRAEESALKQRLGAAIDGLRDTYAGLLGTSLRHPALVACAALAWVGLGAFLFTAVEREFVPPTDRGLIMVFTRAPEGSTLGYLDRYQREVEEILARHPEVWFAESTVGFSNSPASNVNQGILYAMLVPWEKRHRTQQDLTDELYFELLEVPGIEAFPVGEAPLGAFISHPISLVVTGPDYPGLAAYADEIVQRARTLPGVINLQSNLKLNKPQLMVEIDRDRASDLGVSVREVATTLQILLGGVDLSTFKLDGEIYDVIAQLESSDRSHPRDLDGLRVRGENGRLVSLDSIVTVRESLSAPALARFDRDRSAEITGNLLEGVALGEVLVQIREIAEEILPADEGYAMIYSGESERFYESSNALLFAYLLALVLIYLVLAGQFESFVHPATILVAVALSFPGALLALFLTGNTLNLFSQIGLVMLVGLVTKNSILIVEFANRLREQGHEPADAVREAARTRFRPILMTALSTIAGILPIAIGLGAGGEARAPLGVAIVGGMAFATLLSLFVVPVIYLGFARIGARAGARTSTALEGAAGG